jgi:uncharacterized protein with von Willebrand factor type A (vWA) domain
MEASIHRFVRLLRISGMRVSVSEALDAMRGASQPGVLVKRATLRAALRAALVKDRRDSATFDDVFEKFFSLVKIGPVEDADGHGHSHDDLSDTGELDSFTLSEEPGPTPQQGHDHGDPVDIRDYFDPEDLAQQFNLHQEANKLDLASMTDEIVFSTDTFLPPGERDRVQIEADRVHGAGLPGTLAPGAGTKVDADLTVAEQEALLGWLNSVEERIDEADESDARELRAGLAGVLENLPAALKAHLKALLALEDRAVESRELRTAEVAGAGEAERLELEQSLRRLARTLHGALTQRHRPAARGRVDAGRTMRANMGYDGIPFRPVTTARTEDKPRLVVLADVSLSVRATARFTLSLVHGLQDLFAQVRSFVFVSRVAEVTELFSEHQAEEALGLVFGGDILDVDANSDYGAAFGDLLADYSAALSRRTTLIVLGDGRGNGNDPNLAAFSELARRARETIWLTPEPRYSWQLGGCDLPAYAEHCDRVRVVRDLSGLEHATEDMAARTAGR